MINRFIFTHPGIDGEIHFEFMHGYLVEYSLKGSCSVDMLKSLLKRLPLSISEKDHFSTNPEAKWVELQSDLSFDNFWNVYAHKVPGSSKKEAEARWKKLSDLDKQLALKYIPAYNAYISKSGIGKKYAETYLQQRIWNK